MLFGFMSMFMLAMCLAGAFMAMFRGVSVLQEIKFGLQVQQSSLLFCQNSRRRGVGNGALSSIPEEALALLFDAMVPHQAS